MTRHPSCTDGPLGFWVRTVAEAATVRTQKAGCDGVHPETDDVKGLL